MILWPLLWYSGRPDHYWGIGKPYLYSFPFLIVCVYTIARIKHNKPNIWSRATLAFLIPAFGHTNLQNALVALDKKFMLPFMGAEHTVNFLQLYNRGIAPLIIGSGIAGCLLPQKKMGVYLIILGLISALHHFCTYEAAVQLLYHNSISAGYWLNACVILYILTPVIIVYIHPGTTRLRSFCMAILGAYLLGPPAWFHLRNVPIGNAHPQAPTGDPSIGFSFPSANPESPNFYEQLDQQDSYYLKKARWWCNAKSTERWKTRKRESSGLAARADLPLSDIDFLQIFRRSTTQISLIGRSNPPISVLKKHTANPAVHIWLDPPPVGVRYGRFQDDTLHWLGPHGSLAACSIWIEERNTFGGLFTTVEYLKKTQCQDGVFIGLGPPEGKPYKWTTPFACSTPQMK